MVSEKAFIEWAEVHGNLYGTSITELERIEKEGKNPLLEIDVQGWHQAKGMLPNALSIFILPPSLKSLWERLEKRGSDSLQTRWVRLQNAYDEISTASEYDVFIVNKDLELAYQKLKSVILDGKRDESDTRQGLLLCEKLNEEFRTADWIKDLREKLGG